jgi:tRNA (cmo5U34)-methyltransferase
VVRILPVNRDEVLASGRWEFDEKVTAVFDDMLARSIPGYEEMRRTTTELAVRFAQPNTAIVDLGCSRGAALEPIADALGPACVYVGVEVSEPMRAAAVERFKDRVNAAIYDLDLRDDYPTAAASVTLAVLTLQFVPIEYRQRIIADAWERTVPGGVFLLVEKVLGSDAFADRTLVETYLERKGENGYTPEQINAKRRSLEGVLVPVTADWNVQLLERAGWAHVDCYWRCLNFGAWIGVKP